MENGLGNTPYISRGSQVDPKQVFQSDLNQALTKVITISPGYGWLQPGTIMARISESTSRLGQWVPYAIQQPASGMAFPGGTYILQSGTAAPTVIVSVEDSYRFAVGDHLGAVDNDATPIDLGAVVSIDRTTSSVMATITVTNNITTAITTGAGGMIFIQTQTTTPFVNAVGFLIGGYETGVGKDAKGAQAVVVISHAKVRKGMIPNYDSGALTDLGGVLLDNEIILK